MNAFGKLALATSALLLIVSAAYAQDAATPTGKSDTTTGGAMKSDSMQTGATKSESDGMKPGSTANGTSTLGGPAGKTPDPTNK